MFFNIFKFKNYHKSLCLKPIKKNGCFNFLGVYGCFLAVSFLSVFFTGYLHAQSIDYAPQSEMLFKDEEISLTLEYHDPSDTYRFLLCSMKSNVIDEEGIAYVYDDICLNPYRDNELNPVTFKSDAIDKFKASFGFKGQDGAEGLFGEWLDRKNVLEDEMKDISFTYPLALMPAFLGLGVGFLIKGVGRVGRVVTLSLSLPALIYGYKLSNDQISDYHSKKEEIASLDEKINNLLGDDFDQKQDKHKSKKEKKEHQKMFSYNLDIIYRMLINDQDYLDVMTNLENPSSKIYSYYVLLAGWGFLDRFSPESNAQYSCVAGPRMKDSSAKPTWYCR